ncbi:hypothetical protein ACRE_045580 [Hapsidospora chrysogenum ATCC 11550]|uniref:DUF2293 domain-containing protein n=1 Tax=Hapsidospora chrysogenum (strain ATCC 11550 / CBS 779.69 / DSM 880 / IAM 14645 / JCM 23072 / IMI 49137) TaxID=857340 RepID=A0A086T5Q6_HAPC1|nr:hypothetical protein ACRE_045580 [Hapsidospora chrysogenum ATCC 11550]
MGREKKKKPQAIVGGPKERHRRIPKSQFDPKAPMPTGFVAKPALPQSKSKHHTYFEFVENKNKKKKLEFQVTTKSTPPPGFEFVPIGNPALTRACKELSREKDAMIFIVSARFTTLNTKEIDTNHLSHHVHRTGHHIREAIVEEARVNLADLAGAVASNGEPEPLPSSQAEYTAQANNTILDLFPRIPHTDRQSILVQSFNLSSINQRPKPVGLCTDMPLSRRVQLAVLAHIRHNHTRYDELLKETSWQNARKVVEALCLDILVKWRGDEETGRDQLDEILREVVVISDSDSEESGDESGDTADSSNDAMDVSDMERDRPAHATAQGIPRDQRAPVHHQPQVRAGPVMALTTPISIARPSGRNGEVSKGIVHGQRPSDATVEMNFSPQALKWLDPSVTDHNNILALQLLDLDQDRWPWLEALGQRQNPIVYFHANIGMDPPLLYPSPTLQSAMPRVHDQMRTTEAHSRHVTPVADRLQDMLVPSIEPMSPDTTMQPRFVRTLPPRLPPSPARRPVAFRPESASPSMESGPNTKPFYSERRVIDDRPAQEPPQGHHGDPYGREPAPGYYEPRPVFHPPLPSNVEPRAQPFGTAPAPAQRIAGGMGRPGDRSNPIFMEDRGGFFERVYDEPGSAFPRRSHADPVPASWAPPAASRVPEPHRVVSWEEGSRILRESRNDANVEVIPISGARTLPPGAQAYVPPTGSRSAPRPYDPWSQREPQHGESYHQTQAVEPAPLRQDYMAGPSRPRSHQV